MGYDDPTVLLSGDFMRTLGKDYQKKWAALADRYPDIPRWLFWRMFRGFLICIAMGEEIKEAEKAAQLKGATEEGELTIFTPDLRLDELTTVELLEKAHWESHNAQYVLHLLEEAMESLSVLDYACYDNRGALVNPALLEAVGRQRIRVLTVAADWVKANSVHSRFEPTFSSV